MTRPITATRPDDIRRHNLAVMLAHVHQDGTLTRAELTQRLRVSRSTVGALVADLTRLGLIEEIVPTGGAGVGRPSHMIGPHVGGPFAVAVDMDISQVTVAAVGLGGEVLARDVLPLRVPDESPARLAEHIAASIPRLRSALPPSAWVVGVGLSVPGTVDRQTGIVATAPNLDWHDVDLGRELHARVGATVMLGNDADLAVLAERQRGSARGVDDVVFLISRIGVGAGIICNGAPLHGSRGHAGEIGHDVLDVGGPPCHCGKHGCVETYVGGGALLREAGYTVTPTDEAIENLLRDARAGVEVALTAVRTSAQPLGRTIASLVNTLNPQRMVLGGSLATTLELARPEIEAALGAFTFERSGAAVELVQPALGADSSLLGAAEIAFAPLLTDPLGAASAMVG